MGLTTQETKLKAAYCCLQTDINETIGGFFFVFSVDFNRVRLHAYDSVGNDYINASHIQLQIMRDSQEYLWFIACQGPLSSTVADFWCMVWQTKANVVAMLTQEIELGKTKCYAYWPQSKDCPLLLNDG